MVVMLYVRARGDDIYEVKQYSFSAHAIRHDTYSLHVPGCSVEHKRERSWAHASLMRATPQALRCQRAQNVTVFVILIAMYNNVLAACADHYL